MLTLRTYQQDIVGKIRQSYIEGKRAPLAVAPTGAGKTVIFSYIATNTIARAKKVLILVHRVELLRQTSKALMINGVHHGLINPNYTPDPSAPVQVASVQTLVRRLGKMYHKPDLIIVDEAHHATAGTWRTIINHFPEARVLGVTATPCRGDGAGLGANCGGLFDELIMGPQISNLIDLGFLVKPIVYAPKQRLDLSAVRVKMGDYMKDELEKAVDKPQIIGDAVDNYRKLCAGVPTVVFCVTVRHAEHVAEQFRAAGFRFYAVDGSMDDEQRKKILNGLGNGTVDGVCSCDLISEGTDIPAIGCAILLRPTQSTGLYIQQVGRALRPCAGKDRAIILDHVGNVLTHGMPDENRDWSLDGEVKRKKSDKKEKTIKVRQCESCFAVHEPAPVCPNCGYLYPEVRKAPEQVDGELQEVTKDAALIIRKQRAKEIAMAKSYEELLRIERERGYKPGWSKYVYMSRNKRETGL